MLKRPTKTEKKKEPNERVDQGLVKLGLFIITGHLQKFVENRSLQTVLKEHDLVVSWSDEKNKVVVVPSARRPAKSKKGEG